MKLVDDWAQVLRKAWSVKFTLLSAVLGAGEFIVQVLLPGMFPAKVLATLAIVTSLAAAGARIVAQKEVR